MFSFKTKKKKEEEKAAVIKTIAERNGILEAFATKGLITYDSINNRWLIASTLAAYFLSDIQKWTSFLKNLHTWSLWKSRQQVWNEYFKKVEIDAVRAAKKKYPVLSRAEIQSIRQRARESIQINDIDEPKIEPFEYLVTDLSSPDSPIVAIGNFDGENFTMANYEKVKRFLQNNKGQ